MSVNEEVSSPELVLVSPPELAAQAREALPDYEAEFERWVVEIRAVFAAEAAQKQEPEPEVSRFAAFAFTALSAAACAAPLVLLLLARSL